ncbi:MAG TPA: precorrin-8X methylmutase, partial [Nocardioides sp.]|nr:precorrin-8X methylmutase [Nocardioides sp.]
MVHGSGQVDLVDDLVVHPRLVASARAALAGGAPILCDARMVASVDMRGGAPGTRETDALTPDTL